MVVTQTMLYDTLDLTEASEYLRCSRETLRDLAASRQITGAKIGKNWVFVREDLIQYIRQTANDLKQDECSHEEERYGTFVSSTLDAKFTKALELPTAKKRNKSKRN